MNLLSNLVGRLTGSRANPELAKDLPGRCFIVRPHGIKSSRECIYIQAVCSIRSTGHAYQSELVVTRAVDEGDVIDEDDESFDEYSFLIDETLQFTARPSTPDEADEPGSTSFSWRSSREDEEDIWLFVVAPPPDVKADDVVTFEHIVHRCCYERKYGQPAENATEDDLAQFKHTAQDAPAAQRFRAPSEPPLFRDASPTLSEDDEVSNVLVSRVGDLSVDDALAEDDEDTEEEDLGPPAAPVASTSRAVAVSPPKKARPSAAAAPPQPPATGKLPPDDRQLLLSETVDVHLFDEATHQFMLQEADVQANLWLVRGQEFPCWLSVAGAGGQVWISMAVDAEMPVHFTEPERAVIFNFTHDALKQVFTWLLRAKTAEIFDRLNEGFTHALFEASAGPNSWGKLKSEEKQYSRNMRKNNLKVFEPESDSDPEDEVEPPPDEVYSDVDGSDDDNSEEDSEAETTQKKNSQLAVGYRDDLSFVVRGDMVGIFQAQRGGRKRLKFKTNIQGLKTPDGKRILEPTRVMLHEQDTTMVLANPLNPSSLYRLDLTTGHVIDEWKMGEHINVSNFLPGSKFAPTTQEQTFVGSTHNSMFRVDPRLAGTKLVDSEFKQYAGKVDFTSAASTESGQLAFGSGNGEIRLYNGLGKIAKTVLPAQGSAIIGIDTSRDGRYVVATTRTQLIFIDTQIQDGKYQGQLGFDRSFAAGSKPQGRALQLQPQHQNSIIEQSGPISFTPAKFNTGPDDIERTIVTSTGPYVIAWNFRKVKGGHYSSYVITRMDETVIADGFRFGGDRDIIVVEPTDVKVKHKGELVKPTRESLGAPSPRRKASNVVKVYGDDD